MIILIIENSFTIYVELYLENYLGETASES